jgi:hypothetical protein
MVPLRLRALLTAGILAAVPLPAQDTVAVVVHVSVRDSVDRATVRRVFLARQRFWGDGSPARPVNQGARSGVRDLFSHRVLGGPTQDFSDYWNDLWFHGTAPPPTLASDQAVLLFVARTRGAIGYVTARSARAPPAGVRIALVLAR